MLLVTLHTAFIVGGFVLIFLFGGLGLFVVIVVFQGGGEGFDFVVVVV